MISEKNPEDVVEKSETRRNCSSCNKAFPPSNLRFPRQPEDEKKFCNCIKWQDLEEGITNVLDNAERLSTDAKILLGEKRFESATFLSLVAKEEIGKAFLMLDHWVSKRDMTEKEYREIFHSRNAHKKKLVAARRAFMKTQAWWGMGEVLGGQDQTEKERNLYVDFVFPSRYWQTPTYDLEEIGPFPEKDWNGC